MDDHRPRAAAKVVKATREIVFRKQPIELALATLLQAQTDGATHAVLRVRWER